LVRVLGIRQKIKKKSVSIRPIRPIRSPIVSHPFLSYTKVKYSISFDNLQKKHIFKPYFNQSFINETASFESAVENFNFKKWRSKPYLCLIIHLL
jgi:hypothetical protein